MTDDTLSDNRLSDDIIDTDLDEVQESTGSGPGQYEHWRMTVDAGQQPVRIDKFLAEHMQHSSRNRIQTAAEAGCGRGIRLPQKRRRSDSAPFRPDQRNAGRKGAEGRGGMER